MKKLLLWGVIVVVGMIVFHTVYNAYVASKAAGSAS
jgi:hypothetical protein